MLINNISFKGKYIIQGKKEDVEDATDALKYSLDSQKVKYDMISSSSDGGSDITVFATNGDAVSLTKSKKENSQGIQDILHSSYISLVSNSKVVSNAIKGAYALLAEKLFGNAENISIIDSEDILDLPQKEIKDVSVTGEIKGKDTYYVDSKIKSADGTVSYYNSDTRRIEKKFIPVKLSDGSSADEIIEYASGGRAKKISTPVLKEDGEVGYDVVEYYYDYYNCSDKKVRRISSDGQKYRYITVNGREEEVKIGEEHILSDGSTILYDENGYLKYHKIPITLANGESGVIEENYSSLSGRIESKTTPILLQNGEIHEEKEEYDFNSLKSKTTPILMANGIVSEIREDYINGKISSKSTPTIMPNGEIQDLKETYEYADTFRCKGLISKTVQVLVNGEVKELHTNYKYNRNGRLISGVSDIILANGMIAQSNEVYDEDGNLKTKKTPILLPDGTIGEETLNRRGKKIIEDVYVVFPKYSMAVERLADTTYSRDELKDMPFGVAKITDNYYGKNEIILSDGRSISCNIFGVVLQDSIKEKYDDEITQYLSIQERKNAHQSLISKIAWTLSTKTTQVAAQVSNGNISSIIKKLERAKQEEESNQLIEETLDEVNLSLEQTDNINSQNEEKTEKEEKSVPSKESVLSPQEKIAYRKYWKSVWKIAGTAEYKNNIALARKAFKAMYHNGIGSIENERIKSIVEKWAIEHPEKAEILFSEMKK